MFIKSVCNCNKLQIKRRFKLVSVYMNFYKLKPYVLLPF